jgi:hypothetical protein
LSRTRPEAAFALLARLSLQVAALDVQSEDLLEVLKGREGTLSGRRVTVSYPSLDRIKIEALFQRNGLPSLKSEALRDIFYLTKVGIKSWLEIKRTGDSELPLSVTLTFLREPPRYSQEEPEEFLTVSL